MNSKKFIGFFIASLFIIGGIGLLFSSEDAKADMIFLPDNEGVVEDFQDHNQNGDPLDNIEIMGNLIVTQEASVQLAKQEEVLPNDNTVVLYDFNEMEGVTLYDKGPNQVDGIITNPQWVDGYYNGGLLLENQGYVDLGDNPVFDLTSELGIEAWINPTSIDDYGSFVMKNQAYVLQFAPGGQGCLRGALFINGAWRFIDDDTTPIPVQEWTHVAFTYDGAMMSLYVNGEIIKMKSQSGLININTNHVYVGRNPIGAGYWYNGLIDEVQICDKALNLFNHMKYIDAADSNSVASYDFNGNQVLDFSSFRNDGRITPLSDGKFGDGFICDGRSYVEINDSLMNPITTEMSAEAWIYPYSWDDYGPFVMRDKSFALQFAPGGNGYLRGAINVNNRWYCLDDDTTQLSPYTWTHVSMSYDNSNLILYINNNEVDNRPLSGVINDIGNPTFIGKNPIGNGYWYNGIIDEVRVTDTSKDSFIIDSEYIAEPDQALLFHFNLYSDLAFTEDSLSELSCTYHNTPHCSFSQEDESNSYLMLDDSTEEFVSLGIYGEDNSLVITQGITLEALIFPADTGEYQPFIMKDDSFVLQFAPGGEYLRGGVFINGAWRVIDDNQYRIQENKWYHVAFSYDGSSMKLYLNGILIKEQQQTGAIEFNLNPVLIGRNPRYNQWWYSGLLDNIIISDYLKTEFNILTPDELNFEDSGYFISTPVSLPPGMTWGYCEINGIQLGHINLEVQDPVGNPILSKYFTESVLDLSGIDPFQYNSIKVKFTFSKYDFGSPVMSDYSIRFVQSIDPVIYFDQDTRDMIVGARSLTTDVQDIITDITVIYDLGYEKMVHYRFEDFVGSVDTTILTIYNGNSIDVQVIDLQHNGGPLIEHFGNHFITDYVLDGNNEIIAINIQYNCIDTFFNSNADFISDQTHIEFSTGIDPEGFMGDWQGVFILGLIPGISINFLEAMWGSYDPYISPYYWNTLSPWADSFDGDGVYNFLEILFGTWTIAHRYGYLGFDSEYPGNEFGKFIDWGEDGLFDENEPGYDEIANPDPNMDNYNEGRGPDNIPGTPDDGEGTEENGVVDDPIELFGDGWSDHYEIYNTHTSPTLNNGLGSRGSSELQLYYSFDEIDWSSGSPDYNDVKDDSDPDDSRTPPYYNHGKTFDDTYYLGTTNYGRAVRLDGNGDHVKCSDDSTLEGSKFTLESWIFVEDDFYQINGKEYIICKPMSSSSSPFHSYALRIVPTSPWSSYYLVEGVVSLGTAAQDADLTVTSLTALKIFNWYHVALTWDGTDFYIYINGELDGSQDLSAHTGGIQYNSNDLYIGSFDGTQDDFMGVIDEVKIYDYALSPLEMREDYSEEDLQLAFHEGEREMVYDRSKNNFEGEISGATWDGRSLYFDGGDNGNTDHETWAYTLTGNTWSENTPALMPKARYSHAMVFDSSRGLSVLFGGQDSDGLNDETWVYDFALNTWTKKNPTNSPSAREGHAMVLAKDTGTGQYYVVLFGGKDTSGLSDETWVYDFGSDTWTEKTQTTKPSARTEHSLAYDSTNDKVILFGGDDGTYDGETWEYDLSLNTWTNRNPTTPPSARWGHAMGYDPNQQNVVLFGGLRSAGLSNEVWEYDYGTNTWNSPSVILSPSSREGHAMTFDTLNNQFVLFGGWDGSNRKDDTWTYNAGTNAWTQKTITTGKPTPRYNHVMVFDSTVAFFKESVIFGGDDGDGDFVNLGNSYSLAGHQNDLNQVEAFTIECRVKTDGTSQTGAGILGRFLDNSGNYEGYSLQIVDNNKVRFHVGKFATEIYVTSTNALVPDEWNHIVAVFDGANTAIVIYLNGEETANPFGTSTIKRPNADFIIGRKYSEIDDYYFKGNVDNVRLFNYVKRIGNERLRMTFDESSGQQHLLLKDSSIYENDGTAPFYSYGYRLGGYRRRLTLTSNYHVDCGSDSSLALTDEFTVECWIKENYGTGGHGTEAGLCGRYDSSSNKGYAVKFKGDTNQIEFKLGYGTGSKTISSGSGYTVDLTKWNHIMCTFDQGTATIYINGIRAVKEDVGFTSISAASGTSFIIGRLYSDVSSNYYNGHIDEVYVYDYAKNLHEDRDFDSMTDLYEIIRSRTSNQYNPVEYNGRYALLVAPLRSDSDLQYKYDITRMRHYLVASGWSDEDIIFLTCSEKESRGRGDGITNGNEFNGDWIDGEAFYNNLKGHRIDDPKNTAFDALQKGGYYELSDSSGNWDVSFMPQPSGFDTVFIEFRDHGAGYDSAAGQLAKGRPDDNTGGSTYPPDPDIGDESSGGHSDPEDPDNDEGFKTYNWDYGLIPPTGDYRDVEINYWYDDEVGIELDKISCRYMVLEFDICYSGGFIHETKGTARAVVTSQTEYFCSFPYAYMLYARLWGDIDAKFYDGSLMFPAYGNEAMLGYDYVLPALGNEETENADGVNKVNWQRDADRLGPWYPEYDFKDGIISIQEGHYYANAVVYDRYGEGANGQGGHGQIPQKFFDGNIPDQLYL